MLYFVVFIMCLQLVGKDIHLYILRDLRCLASAPEAAIYLLLSVESIATRQLFF
jgi:hypothetical protein